MAKLKKRKVAVNTTVDEVTYKKFKISAQRNGVPMNTLLEAFMRQYNDGEFYLKFGETKSAVRLYDDRPTPKADAQAAEIPLFIGADGRKEEE